MIRQVVVLTALLLAPATSIVRSADPAPDLENRETEVLVSIQNTCFAAYPDELIARMSGRVGPVPEAVRADPQAQIAYLKTEALVSKGLFYPTRLEEILPALRATLKPEMRFLDLGSGDGRVVFLAAHLGARATGIEFDPELHRIAKRARSRLSLLVDTRRAELLRGDFFAVDFSGYDLLFYFGSGTFAEDRLYRKIGRELRGDALFLLAYPVGPIEGLVEAGRYGFVHLYRRAAGTTPQP